MNLYKTLLNIYFQVRPLRVKELLVGTKAWEDYWINRKRGKDWHGEQKDWIEGYWNSINHPHRKLLIDSVMKFNPKTVLEIGCACGVNLRLIKEQIPDAICYGVDINKQAVDYGNNKFAESPLDYVFLFNRKAENTMLISKSVDVVITDAMLIYIGKDKIYDVFREILRVAKKGIVMIERHQTGVGFDGIYRDALWQRDYFKLMDFMSVRKVTVRPIPEGIWDEWKDGGSVIEVELYD